MESYIEAQSIESWEVTSKAIGGAPSESQAKWNARAKNYLFEALSEQVFARVRSKTTAHEIWLELDKIHNVLKKFMKRNIKCSKKNSMISRCFLMNQQSKCMLD